VNTYQPEPGLYSKNGEKFSCTAYAVQRILGHWCFLTTRPPFSKPFGKKPFLFKTIRVFSSFWCFCG
jgi:hypothetical protein